MPDPSVSVDVETNGTITQIKLNYSTYRNFEFTNRSLAFASILGTGIILPTQTLSSHRISPHLSLDSRSLVNKLICLIGFLIVFVVWLIGIILSGVSL